jgi:signal peptidase I
VSASPEAGSPSTPHPINVRASGSRLRSWSRDALATLGFFLALFAARSSLADHYYVPTGSMIPTVSIGDRVVVSKLAYALRLPFTDVRLTTGGTPARGDVVVLRSPEDGTTLLKRVVAVPGDDVAVWGGRLWINGALVPTVAAPGQAVPDAVYEERLGATGHAVRLTAGGGPDFGPTRVGPDQILVLGDNRGESHDGRAFGLVDRGAVLGKVLGVWMRDGRLTWHAL